MRLDDYRTSDNVEGGRGGGGLGFSGGGGGLGLIIQLVASKFGIVGVLVVLAGAWALGMFGGGGQRAVSPSAPSAQTASGICGANGENRFSCQVLASTEDTWGALFQRSGQSYTPTTLVVYTGGAQSGCGAAQAAMGPFYCPTDKKVYLDTSFYNELSQRFGASGDFANAYVIAHEVGHHIQDLQGTLDKVHGLQAQAGEKQGNALQVRVELQADCYAGVWAANAKAKDGSPLLEAGDAEEGLRAAQAIGDDTLQRAAQGVVVPDSFTHGSSAQRMQWLQRGLQTGDPAQCDTFAGA